MRSTVKKVLCAAVLVAATGGVFAFSGASAVAQQDGTSRTNDNFSVRTTDAKGGGDSLFVDYGRFTPHGGKNDDFVQILDLEKDGYGVRAYAWVNGNYKGSKYNSRGYGAYLNWDPVGNVKPGQRVKIKVCLAAWSGAPNQYCDSKTRTITDG